jgi:hypothetical protein
MASRSLPQLWRTRLATCCVVCVGVVGCGGDPLHKVTVSGSVSYDGQPIERGTIRFTPIGDTPGPASAAEITTGKYSMEARGGVPAGRHRVEIEAFATGDRDSADEATQFLGAERGQQFLPDVFNRNSQLEIDVDDARGAFQHDFHLRSED